MSDLFDYANRKRQARTSLEAWDAIKDSIAPGLRKRVCEVLAGSHKPVGGSEVADVLGIPRDSVKPRFAELVDRDLIELAGEEACPITGRNVEVFRLTGRPERAPTKRRPSALAVAMARIDDLEAELAARQRRPDCVAPRGER